MILNRIRLLMGTLISRISGVVQSEPDGTDTGSEQLHEPCGRCQLAPRPLRERERERGS